MTGAARLSNVPARPRRPSARVATRTGDGGETSLFGKDRVRKTDPRIEALGDLDETQAVIGLARSLAVDAGPHGVTSNAVCPGWVRTDMAERSARATAERRGIEPEEVWAERAAQYPEGRVLAPEEVAEVIAFLCSPRASGINGQAITVALGGVW